MMTMLDNNTAVLLQGDSVTDCGRHYNDVNSMDQVMLLQWRLNLGEHSHRSR
jgi:hypothetical protein